VTGVDQLVDLLRATQSRPLDGDPFFIPAEQTRGEKSAESVAQKTGSLAETERNGLTDSALKESVGPESVPPRVVLESVTDSDPESVADFGQPFSLSLHEFVALPREHREPLLADSDGRAVVGRDSLTLLGALGGHGKTTLFIDLALHMVAGVDYPPFTVPRPVSILIIENEGPRDLFQDKLGARLATFPHELKARLGVSIFDWGGLTIANDDHRARLIRDIAEHGYDLVFGDPLDSLGIEGVGSPEDTRNFLALMKETGLNKTVAWWLNTHPRKEETKEALNEIAGAWGGKPDSVFLLRMLADDRTTTPAAEASLGETGQGADVANGVRSGHGGVRLHRGGSRGRARVCGGDQEAARRWPVADREGDRGAARGWWEGWDRRERRHDQEGARGAPGRV
jgi:hypothetical protein